MRPGATHVVLEFRQRTLRRPDDTEGLSIIGWFISCLFVLNSGRTCWADRERGRVTPKRMSSHAGGDIGLWNLYLILPKCMDENIVFSINYLVLMKKNELHTPITEAAQVGHTNRFSVEKPCEAGAMGNT